MLIRPQTSDSNRAARALVALRSAEAGDAQALKILAELDEAPDLSGDVLLALLSGQVVAAMSLEDGRVIADPFVATSDAVSLLKLRARQLAGVAAPRLRLRRRPGI